MTPAIRELHRGDPFPGSVLAGQFLRPARGRRPPDAPLAQLPHRLAGGADLLRAGRRDRFVVHVHVHREGARCGLSACAVTLLPRFVSGLLAALRGPSPHRAAEWRKGAFSFPMVEGTPLFPLSPTPRPRTGGSGLSVWSRSACSTAFPIWVARGPAGRALPVNPQPFRAQDGPSEEDSARALLQPDTATVASGRAPLSRSFGRTVRGLEPLPVAPALLVAVASAVPLPVLVPVGVGSRAAI